MRYRREIEKKFIVHGSSMDTVIGLLEELYDNRETYQGVSTDTFWKQPGVDFVRLRRNTKELSIKITDKITIEDRVEENIVVKDYDTAFRFSVAAFGPPAGELEKNYYVLETDDVVFAVYMVKGRPELYLEVEAKEMETVNEVSEYLQNHLDLEQEYRSLFQIVFGNKEAA